MLINASLSSFSVHITKVMYGMSADGVPVNPMNYPNPESSTLQALLSTQFSRLAIYMNDVHIRSDFAFMIPINAELTVDLKTSMEAALRSAWGNVGEASESKPCWYVLYSGIIIVVHTLYNYVKRRCRIMACFIKLVDWFEIVTSYVNWSGIGSVQSEHLWVGNEKSTIHFKLNNRKLSSDAL